MPVFSRLTSLKGGFFGRPTRRRQTPTTRVGVPLFLAVFAFLSPFSADANNAPSSNAAICLVDANNAPSHDDATYSINANGAARTFPFFSQTQRPRFLGELADVSAETSNWANDANWEPLFNANATPQNPRFSYVANVLETADAVSAPRFTQTSAFAHFPQSSPSPASLSIPSSLDAAIVRGAYLSNLPIAPFRGRIFAYADGSWGRQDEQNESPFASGFNVASFGGGVGQDWRLSKNAIWGLGVQGRNARLDPATSIYESEIDSLAGFLRLSLFGPLWRLDLSIGAAKHWNEQSESNVKALKYSSSQWNYEAEFGVRFDKGYTRVEPLVNVRVSTLQEPVDAERRLALLGRASDYSDASYRLKLGSRFSWEYATHLATLKPFLTATWNHEFGDRALYVVGENTPFPIVYRYAKHRMARDRLDLGGGLDAALRDTVDLFFRYDVEFAKEYANYLFYAGFHKKF